ncbi:hypothetical protein [Arthrobacter sp. R4-81]
MSPSIWALVVPAGAGIGWAGMFVHNLTELPGQGFLSPESFIPFLVTALLVAGWFTRLRRPATIALLFWGLLHFFGGGVLSVLPLPSLPFSPEQTVSHYLFHGIYALAELPLIFGALAWLRSPDQLDSVGTTYR